MPLADVLRMKNVGQSRPEAISYQGQSLLTTIETSAAAAFLAERLSHVLDRETERTWSVPLVKGRYDRAEFRLQAAGGPIAVVRLCGTIEAGANGTHVLLRTEAILRTSMSVLLVLAICFGGLIAAWGLLAAASPPDFGLGVVVPLVSGSVAMLLILVPAHIWLTVRHRTEQTKWLIAFVQGLIMSARPD